MKKKYSHTNHSQRENQREKSFRDEKSHHHLVRNNRPQKSQRKINLVKDGSLGQKDKSHLVAQQMHCIVDIAIKNINQIYESIGSGFIFDGYIFTCSHVVDGHKKFHITTCDNQKIKGKE